MSVHTRSQRLAQAAFGRIAKYEKLDRYFVSFAKRFPALVHACGLAQAVSFARAKKHAGYVEDLAAVLRSSGHPELTSAQTLDDQTRTQPLSGYLRLSRDAIHAAGWLKRYVEAAGEEE